MYRAVDLADVEKDLHRYVWRSDPSENLKDYRITYVTSVKQNALDCIPWLQK